MAEGAPRRVSGPRLVLLTGASGYIGGRLLPRLERRGYRVRCLARRPEFLARRIGPRTQVVAGDALRRETEMRLPGRAWLEFEVLPCDAGARIVQSASFDPSGLSGLLYWYAVHPFHALVFRGMLAGIARRAHGAATPTRMRSRRIRAARLAMLVAATALLAAGWAAPVSARSAEIARADALWAQRAEGQQDGRARPERSEAAVAAYERARSEQPESLEAAWKLLRALWFAAYFASDESEARARYERALAVGDEGVATLAARVGGTDVLRSIEPERLRERLDAGARRDAAELYFWYAVNLGAWSRVAGLVQAVRSGVASRMHEAILRSLALDPDVEQGGALRLLSRLHSELPRVPFVSGFVDPARAVPLAERALTAYPQHPGNSYLLGLALLAHAPERRAEALQRIEATAVLEPRPDHVVEDLAIRIDAHERLRSEARRG
jgi:tetratricopeptide (TPR) repeat protein